MAPSPADRVPPGGVLSGWRGSQASSSLADDPLIGREPERVALEAAVARARAGGGAIVLLAGEAGVGKTALARAVLADCGLNVAEGLGVQQGASAYGPIVQVLRAILRRRAIEPPLKSALAVLVPELGPPRRPRRVVRARPLRARLDGPPAVR
jgi:hypothetical protein